MRSHGGTRCLCMYNRAGLHQEVLHQEVLIGMHCPNETIRHSHSAILPVDSSVSSFVSSRRNDSVRQLGSKCYIRLPPYRTTRHKSSGE